MTIDIDQVAAASARLPELVDEAALGAGDHAPGQRADQRRHVVRQLHQSLELVAARHVGARQDPGQREADQDRHHRRHQRDHHGVDEDVEVLVEHRDVVFDAVFLRRKGHRIADVQRLLDQEHHRQDDEERHDQHDNDRDDRLPVKLRPQRLQRQQAQARLSAGRRRCGPIPWQSSDGPSRRRPSPPVSAASSA